MALDTTVGGASADSYGALADFQAYATKMGWTLTATEAEQEAYLRRATIYLDTTYRFVGYKAASTQALAWPRIVYDTDEDGYSIPSDSIPQAVINAQFELAWVQHGGTDILEAVTTGGLTAHRVKVGEIEEDKEYASGKVRPGYPAVSGMLRGYIIGPGVRLERG